MKQIQRLPAVPEAHVPQTVAVSIAARAQRPNWFSSTVDVDVINESPSPLVCDIRGRMISGEKQLQPGYVWIDPNTTGTLHVRVGLRVPRIHTVIVRMRDSAREYVAQTPLESPLVLRALPLIAACALLAIAGVLVAKLTQPRIQGLSAPTRVIAGDRVDVAYSAGGLGHVQYAVQRDGKPFASGALTQDSGSVAFTTDRRPAAYTFAITISGTAGGASAQRSIIAQPAPSAPILASIHSLDARPSVAISGAPIDVRYSASAQDGTVRLLDEKGTPWDAAPYDIHGATLLRAPHVDAPAHFTIRLEVRNGASLAAASTGIVVLPSPSPSPSSSASPFSPATPPPAAVDAVGTMPAYIVSGTYFEVVLRGAAAHVTGRATLESTGGTPIQSQDIGPGKSAKFIAPAVKEATSFYVMVAATHEKAGQLIVVPVVIHPH